MDCSILSYRNVLFSEHGQHIMAMFIVDIYIYVNSWQFVRNYYVKVLFKLSYIYHTVGLPSKFKSHTLIPIYIFIYMRNWEREKREWERINVITPFETHNRLRANEM